MTRHLWIAGDAGRSDRPLLARIDAHRRLRGPYTAAGSLMRGLPLAPALAARHDVELAAVAPELGLACARETLTALAPPEERTRFYPAERTQRIAHGLTELLRDGVPSGRALVLERVADADPTDREWIATLLRRLDPEHLQLVVCAGPEPAGELGEALRRHAERRPGTVAPAPADPAAFVAAECIGECPAYAALAPAERAALHDARAAALEARGEPTLALGAIPFHRERGSDPAAARAAVLHALQACMLGGFYAAVLDLCERASALLDWEADPEERWRVTSKWTTVLAALGRADEAEALYDEACVRTALPKIHLHAAYGRAMLYTRFLAPERRDRVKAKAWMNTAIALASGLPDAQRRAFMLSFHENGLALIETYLGAPERALALVEGGLARVEGDGADDASLRLHRSVLRYNRAQLLSRMGRETEALAAYATAIAADPNQSEYHLERGHLLRRLGRPRAALAAYAEAARTSPPYPHPHLARAEVALELGDEPAALAALSYALELDPRLLDARVTRAGLLLDAGALAAAREDAEAGLALDPGSAELHAVLGAVAHAEGRLDDAHAAYAAALRCDPELPAAWCNRAALWYEQGEIDRSIADLEAALALGEDPDVRANLELALAARGSA